MKTDKENLIILAHYHKWAYEQLFESLSDVPEQEYKANRGLFFKSIHGTLNHLLLVDRLWLSRFKGSPIEVAALDEEIESDRQSLKEALLQQADEWIHFVENADEKLLNANLVYLNTQQVRRELLYKAAVTHVFNHGTHHRGQISAAVTQLPHSFPVMDLAFFRPAMNREARVALLSMAERSESSELIDAIGSDDYDIVERLLQTDGSLANEPAKNSLSPLQAAAKVGNEKMATLLLLHGAEVNYRDVKGRTALHYAYKYNNFEVGRVIALHKRETLDSPDHNGETALHYAARTNNRVAVQQLLALRASVDAINLKGKRPIDVTHNKEIKTLLLENTASADLLSQLVSGQLTVSAEVVTSMRTTSSPQPSPRH